MDAGQWGQARRRREGRVSSSSRRAAFAEAAAAVAGSGGERERPCLRSFWERVGAGRAGRKEPTVMG
eukprot:5340850-Prorocentrum_lima.AAC.1